METILYLTPPHQLVAVAVEQVQQVKLQKMVVQVVVQDISTQQEQDKVTHPQPAHPKATMVALGPLAITALEEAVQMRQVEILLALLALAVMEKQYLRV
jgi:hypothetical protein